MFCSETKMDRRRIEKFRWMLGLSNMVVHDAVKKWGVAVFWQRGIDVSLRNITKYHIDMDIRWRMVFCGGLRLFMGRHMLITSINLAGFM
jgi:hypothetical protein